MSVVYKNADGERRVRAAYEAVLARWPVPHQQLRVPTREGETFIVASGPESAPPLVVFHGANANAASWMFDVIHWSKHFRVYVVDVIGDAGFSAPSRPPLSGDGHALWLDDVMRGLSLSRAAFVGASLGGWLALDYAVRRPAAVQCLALLCPGGLGAQKNLLLRVFPLLFLGSWGARKMRELVFGSQSTPVPPQLLFFVQFLALVASEVRPRIVKIPVLSDKELSGLKMPMLVILGGKDVLLDTAEAKRRVERFVPQANVRYLPKARHVIPGQAGTILEFLLRAAAREGRDSGQPTVLNCG